MDQDDPDATQRFRPVPRRQPPPSGTPRRAHGAGRDVWARFRALPWVRQKQIAAISVVAALLLVGIVSTVAKEVGSGSNSSGSASSTSTTPLGCQIQPGSGPSTSCTITQTVAHACDLDYRQLLSDESNSVGSPGGGLQLYYGRPVYAVVTWLAVPSPGEIRVTCDMDRVGDQIYLGPSDVRVLTSPGSPDDLPVKLR